MILSVLTATAFAQRPDGMNQAILLHVGSWIAQFLGHGLAEKRAPALLDNLLGGELLPGSSTVSVHLLMTDINSRCLGPFLCSPRAPVWSWLPP
jgi:uncharacterized membrane protein YGL010W